MIQENSRIIYYQGFSLVDVTETKVIRYSTEHELERNQQRNWETVMQLLGLRSQVLEHEQFSIVTADVAEYQFGNFYHGSHKIWRFKFGVEFQQVYQLNNDPVGQLTVDFHHAPVVLNLTETAKPILPLFYSEGKYKNMYFILS